MPIPAWNDREFKAGTMVRGALWLIQEIGEGSTFTKGQIREAFPDIAQADRRIRDLRDYGWIIHTSAEDASLLTEDQRFVKAGVPVWDPAARLAGAPRKAVTAKEKQAVFARDDYMCTVCGIGGGEAYLEDPDQSAVLGVTRRTAVLFDGGEDALLVTECKRCRSGLGDSPSRADEVLADARALDEGDRRRLLRWMERGRRGSTALERAWNAYRRLPADARDGVRSVLEE